MGRGRGVNLLLSRTLFSSCGCRSRSGFRCFATGSVGSLDTSQAQKAVLQRRLQIAGAVALFGLTGVAASSAVNDLLIYDQCSRKAMETAGQDPRLILAVGDEIKRGRWHWFHASLALAHQGLSASCSFPVSGNQGTASIHLKAISLEGKSSSLVNTILGKQKWEILMLEAIVPPNSDQEKHHSQHINLMQATDELKAGDGGKGDSGSCRSISLHEV